MSIKHRILFVLFSIFLVFFATSPAIADIERHALIIGNSGYEERPLINPLNDATDMAQQLALLGYKIYGNGPALDLDRIGIERVVRAFARQLPDDAHTVFFYAGHGVAHAQDNYLIPIGHKLQFQEQLPDRSISLRSVVNLLKNANPEGTNVVLLDACSDNPLTTRFRSLQQGLKRLYDIPRGVFIGYAADVGQVAEDGMGRNGTYTAELLEVMRDKPNVIIELAHKEVAERVFEKTGGAQFPVSESKVYGDWCFGNCVELIGSVTNRDFEQIEISAEKSAESASNQRWMVIGGVLLATIIAGIAVSSDGGSSDPPISDPADIPFTVIAPLP